MIDRTSTTEKKCSKVRVVALLVALTLGLPSLEAEPFEEFAPPQDESSRFETEVLVAGLKNPAGLALRPTQVRNGPYELFIAESGAARVVSVSSTALGQIKEAIVGFPVGSFGEQDQYRVGPQALGFVTRSKLAVVANDRAGDAAQIDVYALQTGGGPLRSTQVDYSVQARDRVRGRKPYQADLLGLAISEQAGYLTGTTWNSASWMLKCEVEAKRLSPLEQLTEASQVVGLEGFSAPTVIPPPRPAYVVAGAIGSTTTPRDSRLVFCLPDTGEVVLDLPTGMDDILCLAYSPTGQLYATDFSWRDAQAGGVYRIDDARIEGRQTCRAVKIAALVRPYGLVFGPEGSLFVTTFGAAENESDGQLVKITGEL